jgi:hypothetical protein
VLDKLPNDGACDESVVESHFRTYQELREGRGACHVCAMVVSDLEQRELDLKFKDVTVWALPRLPSTSEG